MFVFAVLLLFVFIQQPVGSAAAIRKASINIVKTSRNTTAKIMPRITVVISAVVTAVSIIERISDITAANTTGWPKQPNALLNGFLQAEELQNARLENIRAMIAAEITTPAIPIVWVNGNKPYQNNTVNITAVINARNAAVAILNERFIRNLLSYSFVFTSNNIL